MLRSPRKAAASERESAPSPDPIAPTERQRGRRLRRAAAWTVAGLVIVLAGLGAYVGIPVYSDLNEARRLLDENPQDVSPRDIRSARARIESARRRLGTLAADVLKTIPIVGANVDAVDAAATDLLPVTDTGVTLRHRMDVVESDGFLAGGAVRLDVLASFEKPLADQADALGRLAGTIERHRTGALAPPLWTALDRLAERTRELHEAASKAHMLVEISDDLLGAGGERTYLVALINNAELRGAGGVLTGLGTITARNGELQLNDLFEHREFAAHGPLQQVEASPTYVRRYGEFKANTTLTINATLSPDVPEVAVVAAGIYEAVKRTRTDGALVIDPRGLAALMPPGQEIDVAGTDLTVNKDSLARFVYSDAYEVFDDQSRRRGALIDVGRRVFEATLSEGFGSRDSLSDAAAAFAGGHVRFVSFDPTEQDALRAAGATGDITPPESDAMLVAVQNFGTTAAGGTKLDYWARRHESHRCELTDSGASCATAVEITNMTPDGLSAYVAGRPYGQMRDYVEIFVPGSARLLSIEADGNPVRYRLEPETGHKVVSVFAEIETGESRTIAVTYELLSVSGETGYKLVATPQPLARDARIDIDIDAPEDWVVRGPGSDGTGEYEYRGSFTSVVRAEAAPDERTGLPALWEVIDFWD
ncbi:MAG: DUF4012 domain-containing protein [Actinomycetota bacterium]